MTAITEPRAIKADIAALCRDCALYVPGRAAATEQYTEAVGRLLFGTACAESLLLYRRQLGFSLDRLDGAWGLWQTEHAAVSDSIMMLASGKRQELFGQCADWLLRNGVSLDYISQAGRTDIETVMREIAFCDPLAVLFCRLHYLRVPSAVPSKALDQAQYWKAHYNTSYGAGTAAKYLERWREVGADTWAMINQ